MTFIDYLKTLKEMNKDFTLAISCEEHGEFHSENLDYFADAALNISIKCSKCKVDLYLCTESGPYQVFSK